MNEVFRRVKGRAVVGAALMVGLELGCVVGAESAGRWTHEAGFRWRGAVATESGSTGFKVMDPILTRVGFTNALSEARALQSQILPNGSGVAAGDVDGDGWCDLYFCGLDSDNRLFRNRGGWRFEDVTKQAGVACPKVDSTGAVFADVEGDGDLDLLVSTIRAGTRLFRNDGTGRFALNRPMLNPDRGGASMALADIDADGDLDLYAANYRADTYADRPGTRFTVRMIEGQPVVAQVDGRPLTAPDLTNRFNFGITMQGGRGRLTYDERGEVDRCYLNDGRGGFQEVSFTDGRFLDEDGQPLTQPPLDWGLTAAFRDLNQDGHPDLYVCNDFSSPDRVWLNDGRGGFRALLRLGLRQTSAAAMSADFADLDRDGRDEIFQVEMQSREHRRRLVQRNVMRSELAPAGETEARPQYARNMLQWNAGNGRYLEVAQFAGLESTEWSWAPVFLDLDLDGYEDLLVGNGFERDNMNLDGMAEYDRLKATPGLSRSDVLRLRRVYPRLATPNLAFRNLGNLRFEECGRAWGFDAPTISQGLCLADLDNDGDLDVAVNNMNDAAALYQNRGGGSRVGVRLKGKAPNTQGIGARIRLMAPGLPIQTQELMCGGRYLSGDEAMRVFAAGNAGGSLRLEVHWRQGGISRLTNVQPNRIYEVDESGAIPPNDPTSQPPGPWFMDLSARLHHQHADRPFDDRARQPLLQRSLSSSGPGVAWADVNDDGWDDAVISGGTGGRLGVRLNDGQGAFTEWTGSPGKEDLAQKLTSVLSPGSGLAMLVAGVSRYEAAPGMLSGFRVYDLNANRSKFVKTPGNDSVGPMALGDVDADGDLDLFVGGGTMPGQYPRAASSSLFLWQAQGWELDEANSAPFAGVGMVRGAVFTDLDADGMPELVLACDWGPIRVFGNRMGRFEERTEALGLGSFTGWWNGVTAGDFDGDGLMDLAAANWGQNTLFERYRQKPVRLYYGDLDQDGWVELLLNSYFEPSLGVYVPQSRLDVLSPSLPFLLEKFTSHQAFAQAGIEEVVSGWPEQVKILEARTLESMVFLNRQGRFEAQVLPWLAQVSPAMGLSVADLDGDGHQDLVMGQNFFGVGMDVSRFDAGQGLWLRGDGEGGFVAVPAAESGLALPGEQRGVALGDYDADGRVDILVGQHGEETKLYRNTRAIPGMRVRLVGPERNPSGIGAVLRLRHGGALGPAVELHAGAGGGSQDSAVAVLSPSAGAEALWVRWPGGKAITVPIPEGAKELTVTQGGGVERVR